MEKYRQLSLQAKFIDNHDILMTYFDEILQVNRFTINYYDIK
jgi:hypothetical protein